jgi:hypothetical protein
MFGYGSRKKKRRVELLHKIISSFQRRCKMKNERIYNIFNQKNLKHLVRKAVKKKRKP